MYFLYKNECRTFFFVDAGEYRIFKPTEITIRREPR
jgi:hypothetical protein